MKLSHSSQEVLFITDAKGQKTHALLPIETYEQLMGLKDLLRFSAPVSEHELYTLSLRELFAQGYPVGSRSKPGFVLIRDSQLALTTAQSLPARIVSFREQLLSTGKLRLDAEHNCFCLTENLTTMSASFAAALVTGSVRDGLAVWKNREGFSLKESGYGLKKKHKR
ncbi:MAG: DUF4357 domain-containing protein [Succinivibrio sp.]|nr:DUF4357 domain-containing protein [Succinivibrio sp.]